MGAMEYTDMVIGYVGLVSLYAVPDFFLPQDVHNSAVHNSAAHNSTVNSSNLAQCTKPIFFKVVWVTLFLLHI